MWIGSLKWLDTDRVLFAAAEGEWQATWEGYKYKWRGGAKPVGLYEWNVTTGERKRLASLATRFHKCQGKGYVAYSTVVNEDKSGFISAEWFVLPLEKGITPPPADSITQERTAQRCLRDGLPPEPVSPEELRPEHRGPEWYTTPLNKGYGYILHHILPEHLRGESHAQKDAARAYLDALPYPKWYPSTAAEGVEVPFNSRQSYRRTYFPATDEYLFVPTAPPIVKDYGVAEARWQRGDELSIVKLSLRGRKVTTEKITWGDWSRGKNNIFPIKNGGYFYFSGVMSTHSRHSGGWVYRDGKHTKIFDHVTETIGMSPDGCRVVVGIHRYDKVTPLIPTMIDLCQK